MGAERARCNSARMLGTTIAPRSLMVDRSSNLDGSDPPKDWFGFWARFVCGALFGLMAGFLIWLRGFWALGLGQWIIPSMGLICAFAAVRWGNDFSASLRFLEWFRWLWYWRY